MPGVPRREYRESWLGTTAVGPERAAGVGAQPRPPDANPPNGVGGVGSDPAQVCSGSRLGAVRPSRSTSQSAGRSFSEVGS